MPQAHFLDTWTGRIGNVVAFTFWTPIMAIFISVGLPIYEKIGLE